MKSTADWFGDRPGDFSPDEREAAMAWIAQVQADARVFSDAELETMAAACWDRVATVKWADFFTGTRELLKGRYVEDMRAAVAGLAKP